jgi:hypothetical protein
MRLDGEQGFVELKQSELGEPGTPGDGDILLNVTVQVSSYSAADQHWVVALDWKRFLSDLHTLDERRQGSAILQGASPEDLRLEFYSTDSAGHMAVRGHLGWHRPDGHFLQLRFGFSFEPDRLPKVVRALEALRG